MTHLNDYLLTAFSAAIGALIASRFVRRPPPIPRDNSPLSFNRGEFAVILKDAGANKLATIKAVRELTSFGLKDAKDFVDAAGHPAVLVQGITKQEAIAIASKFDGIATADIVIPVDWRTASSEE
jgi:large subunit ribosomal protein L7/L12